MANRNTKRKGKFFMAKNSSNINKNTEFVGPVCESSDTFISYNKYQKLNEGDYVCINNIGAY